MMSTDTATHPTADELDAALLALLQGTDGQSMSWRELRELLPDPRFWARLQSLTRLVERGAVDCWKDDQGRNYVALAVCLPAPRPRRGAA